MKVWRAFDLFVLLLIAAGGAWLTASTSSAATFTNSASIKVDDPTGALTSASGPFTVSCWFRMSIPSGVTLTDNMTILMDRSDGNESANFAYLIRFNAWSGNVEFVTHGSSGSYTNVLIQRPYLERWYHVAIVRSGSSFSAYVDGRPYPIENPVVGTSGGGGLSVGGINGTSKLFHGDIIEVAFYNTALSSGLIQDRMFKDQRAFPNLKGYYKLGFSTNAADFYRNFVSAPPSGTDPATKLGSGNIDFEETDAAGEQSLFDSRKNRGQDALVPLSGAFSWSQTAFARPVPGIAFDFRFGYSSATPANAPADGSPDPYDRRVFGSGWRSTFDTRVVAGLNQNEFQLITWDGGIEVWTRTNIYGSFSTRHHEYRGEFIQLPTGEAEWTTPERLVYRFHDPTDTLNLTMAGRLLEIRDFNGNVVSLQWNEDEALLTNIVDTAGANYRLNYDFGQGLLTSLAFDSWQVDFTYDGNRLASKSVTNTSGTYSNLNTTWRFRYDANGLLDHVLDPRGSTNIFVQYDQYGRQTNQVDALNRASATRYGVPGKRQITRIDPGTNSWIETYDRKGHILAQQDPLTNITSYTYDTNGNRVSITEPLGWKTTFGYDSRANVVARTNALGEITRWAFHGFFNRATNEVNAAGWTNSYVLDNATGNLLTHYDDLGTLVSYTYRTNGLVETSTDANGHVSRFTYDTNGFLVARTDAATNNTSFAVNDVGWKLAETNALGQVTTFAFDLNGNVVRTVDPLQRVFTRTFNPNGNLIAASDAKAQLTWYAYDTVNQRTQMVDRASNAWTYTYTTRGKPERATDPLGFSVTNFYDSANRLVRVSDPLGNSVTNGYDANGNPIVLFDKLGRGRSRTIV
jgi:YD repeat-containing protein